MPNKLRPMLLALILAASAAGLPGCGGSNGPDPSIQASDARTLLAKLTEIQANVDVGSCLVAGDKTDDLLADIQALPSSVNGQVRDALENGANQLKLLLADPNECQGRSQTTTSTPSTTESTTTQQTTRTRTQPTTTTPTQTQPTTPTQTQTQTTLPPNNGGSGGIGPGGL